MEAAKDLKPITNQNDQQNKNIFQKLISWKVGVIPFPLYIALALIIFLAAYFNQLPNDMLGGFAIIMILGIILGDVGQRIPILKDIGGPAILSLFVPSFLVFFKVLNPVSLEAVTTLMKTSNFLYFYIACLVAGSILGMHRTVLIQGFMRMFVPLLAGTIAAVTAGILVGLLFGYSPYEAFFFIIVPIIAGGIGEGILPLSLGYSQILGQSHEAFVSQLIPAAIIGNVVAIIAAGLMKKLGEKRPELNGNGRLVKSNKDHELFNQKEEEAKIDLKLMGAGVLIACSFFIFGGLVSKFIAIPGAILMIISAALVKYAKLLPASMEKGAHQLYKFMSSSFTWPLMVGLGILYIPLDDVASVISLRFIAVCASVVIAMVASGYYVGKLMNMYPVESAIVTGCHSGLGGTGDVAILSASGRMGLMPFAQISTRIGGASTVIAATILLKLFTS
ncbi:2-hydroxycarboxylate transporter family protein [Bacillus sp. NSP9.1]|uniref:2-hydroxycarboxylate transporter family protein n=1 Tax=Bacillus sp. NSP9.1 TaxID=1071078 RepID=UPI00041176F0|nr:2-hydroxycarboxylate transporter family protein [Bacillus sp. NSP9.1]QHZ45787.1 2-hydroxycarboxylate transporter family protein [Bacillus sp. NSP9.1]